MDNGHRNALAEELLRIEEDCEHTAKGHFNASERLSRHHWVLGGCAMATSAAVGVGILAEEPLVSGVLALTAAILTALVTFLKPAERAVRHHETGSQFLSLRNDARRIRNLRLPKFEDGTQAVDWIDALASRQSELNQTALQFSRADFEKARKGIEEGDAAYAVDEKTHDAQ